MQLTIKATGEHVEVLSHLLAKNPHRLYEREVNGHLVRMFFSHFSYQYVEVTFFVTPDSIELSRDNADAFDITSYINDREFAISSIFCTLLRSALGTALNGKPKEAYLSWVDYAFQLEFSIGPLAKPVGDHLLNRLFEPLGYEVFIELSDQKAPADIKDKGSAQMITLKGKTSLQTGLRQLFVLIPVLDDYKHYYIDEKEVEKINRYGEGWLENHPERSYILEKALRFKAVYQQYEQTERKTKDSAQPVKPVRLNEQRYETIVSYVNSLKKKTSVVDFGSGEGKLTSQLGYIQGIQTLFAVEPSEPAMNKALKRFEKRLEDPRFLQPIPVRSSLFYYDERLQDMDVMILCEVIEHIDEQRLPKIMDTLLDRYRPNTLLISTPNQEYNQIYDMGVGYRHPDHRFEWTRDQFKNWCETTNNGHYDLSFTGIGEEHASFGCPTQLCCFTRKEPS
ncbi:3' terminal RNA ribose 2'-O-methyltransferase Hen1 [Alkalihalobacillus xiaoxiensis]|uniref:Small RNA 2'-O-methyltransferase n=1 Tax=Shouchella xiaoxiensis TaxID=766895 RepID=A0ABS2SWV5_9BACI|nr:3' terminal RNA ribose 2'-O-methyltransferase Hen1 [Shouchella xiaoxiensis]